MELCWHDAAEMKMPNPFPTGGDRDENSIRTAGADGLRGIFHEVQIRTRKWYNIMANF